VRDCRERPRKFGANYNVKSIAADEVIYVSSRYINRLEGQGNYDNKRDRWDGYDAKTHKNVFKKYEGLKEARRKKREEELDSGTSNASFKLIAALAKKGEGKGKKKEQEEEEEEEEEFGSSVASEEEGNADKHTYADGADVARQKTQHQDEHHGEELEAPRGHGRVPHEP
jgi:pre-mRNA-processing factor SLU7